MQRASLKDVAKLSGVSAMTVSNVINGKLDRVSEPIADKVRHAVAELDYRPQSNGLRLRLRRSFAVGLVVVHPDRRFLDDPFITELAAGLSNQLAKANYHLAIFGASDESELKHRVAQVDHVDALAVICSGDTPGRLRTYQLLAGIGLPMAVVADPEATGALDRIVLRQDDRGGAQALAVAVCGRGAQHLLFVGPQHVWPAMSERLHGIGAGLSTGTRIEELRLPEFAFDAVVAALTARLSQHPRPDAVLGGNDFFGIAALHAANALGIEVPRDMAVSGFNAFAARAYCRPLLSSVTSRAYEMGKATSDALLNRLTEGRFAAEDVVFPLNPAPGDTV